jgi:hypothetical protein
MTTTDQSFDPYLTVHDANGASLASNDDSGGNMDARINPFIAPAPGRYMVRAGRPGSAAPYTLAVRIAEPRPIALGETASSTLDETVLWAFDGAAGQPIKVAVDAASGESASVALWSETGRLLTSGGEYPRDAASNTIDGYILPAAGRYLVRIGGLSPSTRYDLAVAEARTRAIQPDQVLPSTTISDTLWTMDLAAGQILDIALTATDSSFDPYLTLYDANGISLASNDDSGGNMDARINPFIAPAAGRYVVRAGRPGYDAPYALAVRTVQPRPIAPGETQSSNTRTDGLWQFTGRAGQVIDIDLTGWVQGGSFDPLLALLGPDGQQLAQNDDIAGDNWNARIAGFLLPQTGVYYIQTGRPNSTALYSLALRERTPGDAVLGSRVQVAQSGAYRLSVDRPTLLRVSTDQPAALTLAGPGGETLTQGAPAILRRLGAVGDYIVGVSLPAGAQPLWLNLDAVSGTPRPLAAGTDPTRGRLSPGAMDIWTLSGAEQRAVRVTVDAAGFTPQAELWASDGARLAAGAELAGILPAEGESLLTLRATDVRASGPYTLTVQPASILPGPQACNSSGNAADYLPVRVGSTVILSRHRSVNDSENWDPAMSAYLGRPARVTNLLGTDGQGCPVVQVDLDQGQYQWRVRDMVVVVE